ncbi:MULTISPECIES: MerR family transcriptional regulator [Acidocella]|uniref:MerR family transcriptional regulator n=1 Tax=Acidocella TaxID=50709 RepID=UPI00028F197E|nr:MerR family DNA-binding transcriptional regulator [Acidocella facilis]EKN00331.1 transcriptional regulator [Acidocella sp. MX-AZ02]
MSHQDPLYTVTQLGAELGITVRTLHFYEAQGLLTPRRIGNNRVYSQRDRARMILILRGKRLGFSIKEIKEYIELYDVDPTQGQQTKQLLKAVHHRIQKLEDQRVALEQTLNELRGIELQCQTVLERLGTIQAPPPAPKTEPKSGVARKPARAAKTIGRSN